MPSVHILHRSRIRRIILLNTRAPAHVCAINYEKKNKLYDYCDISIPKQ